MTASDDCMVTYSHNFEDVMLRRVFADVKFGFYVDVGAGWPTKTSNTFDLYKKGWRGIIVEPLLGLLPEYERAWKEHRPDDILVKGSAGRAIGAVDFYMCNQRNMSTGSGDTVAYWKKQGGNFGEPTLVPMQTLRLILNDRLLAASVVAQNVAPLQFHLLCIDVEGMEWDVISGCDLEHFRPWLMLIEATKPGSYESNCEHWEPHVLQHGYSCVYEDGANRWYLAHEHADLHEKFRYPPCCWDNFISWREVELGERVKELERERRKPLTWASSND
ncbi:MAG: hypothetical protein C5B60_07850 [Chloroflexi bacterium]|nr:MAG: hypothetical protein C5B60_07850 [Chloroflexota bacterium]